MKFRNWVRQRLCRLLDRRAGAYVLGRSVYCETCDRRIGAVPAEGDRYDVSLTVWARDMCDVRDLADHFRHNIPAHLAPTVGIVGVQVTQEHGPRTAPGAHVALRLSGDLHDQVLAR